MAVFIHTFVLLENTHTLFFNTILRLSFWC